ncbi:2638_t:CDS:2, partial [Rhizophagus irregularis]
KIKDIDKELKCNIMEFINAPIGHNILTTESHPQACYTSRILDFTSKKLNEILESEDLNSCIIKDLKSLDKNTSKKLNEILESEDSQTYYASHSSTGITEELDDCIIKDTSN